MQLQYDLIHVPNLDVSFDFLLSSFLFSTTVTKKRKVSGDHSVVLVLVTYCKSLVLLVTSVVLVLATYCKSLVLLVTSVVLVLATYCKSLVLLVTSVVLVLVTYCKSLVLLVTSVVLVLVTYCKSLVLLVTIVLCCCTQRFALFKSILITMYEKVLE